ASLVITRAIHGQSRPRPMPDYVTPALRAHRPASASTATVSAIRRQTLPTRLGGIVLLGEQLEAHRLCAFIFNFETARHGSRADVEGMRLAGPPIGQHPELRSRTVKLRLISHHNSGASGGRDGCKSPH